MPNAFSAVVANGRPILKTGVAENASVKDLVLVFLYGNAATGTVNFFAHNNIPFSAFRR
jgi:hypothetical protein